MNYTETNFVVRYAETDQMGIVHHSNYPIWYEAGRSDFIRNLGIPYSKIEENNVLLPLIELKCVYKDASRYEDSIVVKTSIKEMTNVKLIFKYEVFKNNEGSIINYGETVHTWTDKNLKPINIKKHLPEIYDILSKFKSRE